MDKRGAGPGPKNQGNHTRKELGAEAALLEHHETSPLCPHCVTGSGSRQFTKVPAPLRTGMEAPLGWGMFGVFVRQQGTQSCPRKPGALA